MCMYITSIKNHWIIRWIYSNLRWSVCDDTRNITHVDPAIWLRIC